MICLASIRLPARAKTRTARIPSDRFFSVLLPERFMPGKPLRTVLSPLSAALSPSAPHRGASPELRSIDSSISSPPGKRYLRVLLLRRDPVCFPANFISCLFSFNKIITFSRTVKGFPGNFRTFFLCGKKPALFCRVPLEISFFSCRFRHFLRPEQDIFLPFFLLPPRFLSLFL